MGPVVGDRTSALGLSSRASQPLLCRTATASEQNKGKAWASFVCRIAVPRRVTRLMGKASKTNVRRGYSPKFSVVIVAAAGPMMTYQARIQASGYVTSGFVASLLAQDLTLTTKCLVAAPAFWTPHY